MNRKIAISAASIFVALSLMGGATFAFFSDTNSSNNNLFSAGTLALHLDDENEASTSATISSSIGGNNMAPGDTVDGFISLHNGGTIPIEEIIFGADFNSDDGDANLLQSVLNLTIGTDTDQSCATPTDITGTVATEVGNGFSPLTLFELMAADYDALPGLTPGETYFLCMTATMDSSAGNEYQGDNISVDFDFTAHQDISQ